MVVDLGRSYDVARLIFWPAVRTTDVFPLRLSGSADGTRWETLGTVPRMPRQPAFAASGRPVFRPRNGWLELVVSPRRLRYVRVEPDEPVGNAPWGVTELQIYQTEDSLPPAPLRVGALVEWLVEHEIERLLADPVASARVDRATGSAVSTLVANGVVDNHGAAPPDWLARPLRLRAGDALLVPIEDEPELRSAWRPPGRASSPSLAVARRSSGSSGRPVPRAMPAPHGARRVPRVRGRRKCSRTQLEAGLEEEAPRLGHSTLASDSLRGRRPLRSPCPETAAPGSLPREDAWSRRAGMGGPDALCRVGSPAGGGARPHAGPLRARRRELRRRGSQSSVHPRR